MARYEQARSAVNADADYQAGGAAATIHHAIETHMIGDNRPLPDWTLYAEARSPTDQAMRQLSRAVGVTALVAGSLVTCAGLTHLL